MIVFNIVLFAIGLFLLIKGGDWFVDGSTGVARKFRIPEILIGATVVSIGTTLPEVMVSATAASQGSGSTAYGNAIGSIICNTALIAALTIAIKPAKADKKSLRFPVIFFFGAAVVYALIAYFFGEFYRWTGIVLLVGFIGYMAFQVVQAVKSMKPQPNADNVMDALDDEVEEENQSTKGDFLGFILIGISLIASQIIDVAVRLINGTPAIGQLPEEVTFGALMSTYFVVGIVGVILLAIGLLKLYTKNTLGILNSNIVYMLFGAVVIAVGATLLVDNGTVIAEALHVPETVIALTFVALGTSLPELVTAVTALAKGHSSLSLGNIIGANIFNLVLVSGAAITIKPFDVPAEKLINGMNASLLIDVPLVFIAMGILTIPTLIRGKLARWQGISLLCIYAAFCAVQFLPIG